ncbi:thiamine diphosphokinase [Eubacteriales bacterium OttesenSCG-928-N13]|nr:thiamine diphosphokinase [Eubacteriales bacterium OttesenSCG-928-N13]
MNICYIVGAGSFDVMHVPNANDFVIAADGGHSHLLRIGQPVDLLLGDFDSLDVLPNDVQLMRMPPEKDDTDTMLAVKLGLEKGFRRFAIYGGLGGRLDHTMANVQALSHLAMRDARGFLIGEGMVLTAVRDGELLIPAGKTGYISVFCMGDQATGVDLIGLRYPLHDATLTQDVPLGVSNEFTNKDALIRVRCGTLLVMWYETGFDPNTI